MKPADKPEFVKLLQLCYSALNKSLPTLDAIDLWVTILEPYSIEQVRGALSQHMRESKFPPVPADVVTRLPKETDGFPDSNEAWAIALRSSDEAETVVWTREMAEAFSTASIVLEGGDEVGARMAFKATYERLVEQARWDGRKAEWVKSLGHDPARREAVLTEAVESGRLKLAHVAAVLPALAAPAQEYDPEVATKNIERMKAIVEAGHAAQALREQQRALERQAQIESVKAVKRDVSERVAEYEEKHS